MKLEKKLKKSFHFKKKNGSNTDTKIGPWFWFPIPKPGFGRTLTLPLRKFVNVGLMYIILKMIKSVVKIIARKRFFICLDVIDNMFTSPYSVEE